jgi:flagellar assembly protein FliH
LSKVFIPQFSPPTEPSREFVTKGPPSGQDPKTMFPLEWPHLQSPENNRVMKEKEEKVLKQARDKGLLIEKEAYEKGFAQGEKDGLELAQKRFEPVLDSFRQILEGMDRLHRDLYKDHEREMVQLIFAITRKILRHDLPLPEAVIKETLRAAFQYVIEPRKIAIHLNPKDHQYLLSHPDDLPWGQNAEMSGTKIVPDPSITRGGCFLETSFGDIDATLESQLDQIISMMGSKVDLPNPLPHRSDP